MDWTTDWAEQGRLSDGVIRWGIRQRLSHWTQPVDVETIDQRQRALVEELRRGPIALATDEANQQHYELPAPFFEEFLGPHRKYSSCYFPSEQADLETAERTMLELTCQRAGIVDGQSILELGCGWGSLSLWLARRYPASSIVAVSNSNSQREHILNQARHEGLLNLEVITQDLNHFDTSQSFDRVVSIECFEHLRNYEKMFARIRRWLLPTGRCFLHVFCHREFCYPFNGDSSDWMGRYFFQSGLMPSNDLFYRFSDDLRVIDHWRVNGRHYQKTLDAWLVLFDRNRARIREILRTVYPAAELDRWMQRWRMFFMACSELFGYAQGNDWHVSHYLLAPVTKAP
jgi:cyclopropane-fatty-acyl-phospholipid synthase